MKTERTNFDLISEISLQLEFIKMFNLWRQSFTRLICILMISYFKKYISKKM